MYDYLVDDKDTECTELSDNIIIATEVFSLIVVSSGTRKRGENAKTLWIVLREILYLLRPQVT